jgi:MerR family Zn(II)-responsive transcriptional regulator of zntA
MDAQGSDKDGGCGQDASAGTPKRRRTAKSEHLITLKAMVDGAKTTPRAVRLYEAEKLISAAQRSSGGHRLFDEGELDKLRLIIDLRACGFSIEEIRELLAARQTSPSKESAMALQALLSRHIEGLKRKLALITELGREFQCAVETLDRCATCDNPAGKSACLSCEVLTSRAAPRCMRFI